MIMLLRLRRNLDGAPHNLARHLLKLLAPVEELWPQHLQSTPIQEQGLNCKRRTQQLRISSFFISKRNTWLC